MRRMKYIIIMAAAICFAGCKSMQRVVEVPVEVHDTVYQKMVQHDSIYIDHFREVTKMNDTIYVTDEVTKTKIVTKTDTAYKYVEKPVVVTEVQTKTIEVEKPLSWIQKTLMVVGVIGVLLMIGLIIYVVWKYLLKR